MFTYLRRLNDLDKSYLAVALANVGVKARIRKFPRSFRICFEGNQALVLSVLNSEGYRNAAGQEFSRFSFNQPHEIFVHGNIS